MIERLPPLDIAIVVAYLLAIVGMSFVIAWRQRTGDDYFLAGRSMGPFPLACSILANQASAVSLVGAPAFVALREGGGLRWLQYELAVPLSMLLITAILLPALRSVPGASIYAYAEERYDRTTRRALAGSFLLARGLALGVILYASALVVAQALGCSVNAALLGVGLFSVAYTSLGGIVADIWSDVLQLVLLWGGTFVCAFYLLEHAGFGLLLSIPVERTDTIVLSSPMEDPFSFLPMVFGGLFLYLSYYGCDQSQAQRLLTARSDSGARRALLLNGLLRFPLVLTYCAFGLLLAGLLKTDASFASAMEGHPADSLVPVFMMSYLPTGLRGLLLAAILAAAMSSIDSALNSLAAVTLDDVVGVDPARQSVWLGRAVSLAWGIFAVVSGMVFARSGAGVLELVNMVGSAFYGPLLAVFVLGAVTVGVTGAAVLVGLGAGLAGNLALAWLAPGIPWLWWNPAGFLVAFSVAFALGKADFRWEVRWNRRETGLLLGAFALMLGVLAVLPALVASLD
ncbi:MAG TPA: sodium transporter [Vicinamibacteria bacterium]